ncbi:TetR/AcrR family transcriptional regulator [Marinospirillum sp.]|uniref:TetR/AcrR family transcriptional regulator n=1 Tax=Marinospirillum sp. TaxID=2183934 RepID=UPI003A8AFA72
MSQRKQRSNNSSEITLDAAERVAKNLGPGKVSLDSVAKEAGLTKGGVLYNFPSKTALIEGMLSRLIRTTSGLYEQSLEEVQGHPKAALVANLKVAQGINDISPQIPMAILTGVAQKPDLLKPLREVLTERYQRMAAENADSPEAEVMWLAAEGMQLLELLGIQPFTPERKEEIFAYLLEKGQAQ